MRIDVLTLFPEMFEGVFGSSILGKARERGKVKLSTVNFRDFANNKHNTVDDTPYGGGGGMVLKPEPIFAAVESVIRSARVEEREGAEAEPGGEERADREEREEREEPLRESAPGEKDGRLSVEPSRSSPRIILMCPQGEPLTQAKVRELAAESHLVFICGHYEGFDERIREHLVTDELSIGDYVLTGGELPAMVVIDAVVRLLPGVLGNDQSAARDSFSDGLLEHPHYTRPPEFRGWKVPDVLLSGNHAEIDKWRRRQSLLRTAKRRPDLLRNAELTEQERRWLEEVQNGTNNEI